DPTRLPEPKLLFLNGKSFLTPMRLIQFLALVVVFSGSYAYFAPWVPWLADFLSSLGRNSLNVFFVASLFGLFGQIVCFLSTGSLLPDTIIVIGGIGLLRLTAGVSEWRDRRTTDT